MVPKITEAVLPVLCSVWQEPVSVNATLCVPAKVSTVRVYPTKKQNLPVLMQSGRSLSVLILPYMPEQYPVSELSVSIGTAEYKVAGVRLPMIQHLHPYLSGCDSTRTLIGSASLYTK